MNSRSASSRLIPRGRCSKAQAAPLALFCYAVLAGSRASRRAALREIILTIKAANCGAADAGLSR